MESLRNMPGLGDTINCRDTDSVELPQMRKFLGGVRHFRMEDVDRSRLPATLYCERWITAVLLMNANATAALAKRIYLLNTDAAATPFGAFQEVDGLASTPNTTRLAAFADPFLPSTGIPQYYAGWFIVAGPTIALTAAAFANAVALSIGDRITVANEATGRISGFAAPGTNQQAMDYANSVLGYACEAAAAGAVGDQSQDKWIMATCPWFKQ